jgi:hypothetical protein
MAFLLANLQAGPAGRTTLEDLRFAILEFHGAVKTGLDTPLAAVTKIHVNPNCHWSISSSSIRPS